MDIEEKNQFIKIQGSLIRVSKIEFVKARHIIKANNFGKVSDGSYPEIIISTGADKHVFVYENEAVQAEAFTRIEQILTDNKI